MSEVHNVTIEMMDLVIDLQKAVNAALTFPSELTITQAVINLESTREALQLLIAAKRAKVHRLKLMTFLI